MKLEDKPASFVLRTSKIIGILRGIPGGHFLIPRSNRRNQKSFAQKTTKVAKSCREHKRAQLSRPVVILAGAKSDAPIQTINVTISRSGLTLIINMLRGITKNPLKVALVCCY
jgi:hypothetical protein